MNKIIITKNLIDIYNYIYNYLIEKYDKKIIDNFDYFEYNNNKYIKIKKSNIHIEYTPYSSAIDKIIINEYIYSFCSSMNNLFYKSNKKKVIIIYKLYLLNINNQLSIFYLYQKFKNYCNFIFITNNINNINLYFLNNLYIENINIDNVIKKKWNKIYKYYIIEYKQNWKLIVNNIFNSLMIKNTNTNFIKENRHNISLLFVSNININEIFLYLFDLFIIKFNDDIEKILFISELFCKYQYLIINSTRYIIHFETLLIQIFYLIHFND